MKTREKQIIDLLLKHDEITLDQLANQLGVSSITIRRDLKGFAGSRLIEPTRNGVRLATVIKYDPIPVYKLPVDSMEARVIADCAAAMVHRGDVIGISGGRICTQLALRVRLLEGISIVTNALNIAAEMVAFPGIRVMLAGGQLNADSFELVGDSIDTFLDGIHINKCFLGTHGLSVEYGMTSHDSHEAAAARSLMQRSEEVIVLADSTKFDRLNLSEEAPISAIHSIITTARAPREALDKFRQIGIRVIIAPYPEK